MSNPDEDDVVLTAILVSYNTVGLLKQCLDRLEASLAGIGRSQVIVVDNASRDDSMAFLRQHYAHHQLVENTQNAGFGRANNQVLSRARGRYVLLLNTDAYVEPASLSTSVAYMESHAGCGVLGARLVGDDGQAQPSCRRFPTPWNVFLLRTGLHRFFPRVPMVDDPTLDLSKVQTCDWVPGCYYLVRRAVLDAVGLFDPRYFLYYEEVDHCFAVKRAGWDVTYLPAVTVVHLGGESAKSDAELTKKGRQISVLQAESELLFFRKHHGLSGAWLSLTLNVLADAYVAFKGALRGAGAATTLRAWANIRLMANVFVATRAGRRATR